MNVYKIMQQIILAAAIVLVLAILFGGTFLVNVLRP
jgi:hypothetical protein